MFVASMPQHVVVQRERTQESACAHKPLSLALSHCDAPPAAESGAQFAMLVHRAACKNEERKKTHETPRDAAVNVKPIPQAQTSTRRNSCSHVG